MSSRALTLAAFLCFAAAADASAQTCLGLPSFAVGPYQGSFNAVFTEGLQKYGGGFALGTEEIFGGATLAVTNFSDIDDNSTSFGAHAGANFTISDAERIEACPVASVTIAGGPDIGDADVSGIGLRAGGRLGMSVYRSGNLELVPTFGLDLAFDRVTAELGGVETSERETYGIARVGVGFLLNERIGILPILGVPLGLDDADPEFSITLSYTFGR
jgi:hypothetical protein